MASIAVLVSYRVADLAGKVAKVLFMLRIILRISPDVFMAVFAFYDIGVIIPAFGFSGVMQFLTVAVGTKHRLLCPMKIGGISLVFPEVLRPNTGAVAGNAVILRGRSFAELMVCNKTTACLIGSADMALSARSMALLAVISQCLA